MALRECFNVSCSEVKHKKQQQIQQLTEQVQQLTEQVQQLTEQVQQLTQQLQQQQP